ncbi:hypothetical protein [Methanoculleus chikugoensis]|nr:hypothetical protein [Methanoculleus chikugoensis]
MGGPLLPRGRDDPGGRLASSHSPMSAVYNCGRYQPKRFIRYVVEK